MKKKINLIILILGIFALHSCDRWLDIDLINMRKDSDQFSSEHGFKEALAGIYFNMTSPVLYGQNLTFGMLDVMSRSYDYSQVMNNYKVYRDYDYKDSKVQGQIYSIWLNMYSNIASINHLLEWGDKNKSLLSDSFHNRVKGEALALRALHHFDIYRLFSPNIKQDKTARVIAYQNKYGVKTPVLVDTEEFLRLIEVDLLEAAKLLEEDPIIGARPYEIDEIDNKDFADQYVARINYYSVKALLARLYIDMGGSKVKDARQFAEEVIDSGSFRLLESDHSINVPKERQDLLFSDEHIFSLRNKDIREYAKSLHKLVLSSDGNLSMSSGYKAIIYENDNEDYRLNWFDQLYIIKYNIDNTNFFFPKVPLIKLSEMYLIAAEGWMEDDPERASNILRQFKQTRTNMKVENETVDIDVLIKEYRKEFLFEGQLFFLYKRLNHKILGNTLLEDVNPSKDVFVLPLPNEEIEYGHRNV